MKKLILMRYITTLAFFILFQFHVNGQLRFVNKDPEGRISKFEILGDKTMVYLKSKDPNTATYVLHEVPKIISNEAMCSNYRMMMTVGNNSANISFDIAYTLFRQTNKYTGTIKMSTHNPKNRSNEMINEYFEINQ